MIMEKFTFRVDVVSDSEIDVDGVRECLLDALDGVGNYVGVTHTGSENFSDQGLKVFAKRVLGISLVTPKAKKSEVSVAVES
jgi:hypothetical protein